MRQAIDRLWTARHAAGLILLTAVLAPTATVWAQQDAPAEQVPEQNLVDLIQAGGLVGYAIILLSLVGLALVIDSFVRLQEDKLIPPALVDEASNLAQRGRFSELRSLCKGSPTLWGRMVGDALDDGHWGIEAIREAVQQQGDRHFTRLRQRVGYVGLIASIAPVLGLLGTVTGMIDSFQVLGEAKGAARPDELASGIAEALITTCMGLIVAVPLMFLHAYLRDRVTRIAQDAAGACERLLRIMGVVHEQQQRTRAAQGTPAEAPAPAPAQQQPSAT